MRIKSVFKESFESSFVLQILSQKYAICATHPAAPNLRTKIHRTRFAVKYCCTGSETCCFSYPAAKWHDAAKRILGIRRGWTQSQWCADSTIVTRLIRWRDIFNCTKSLVYNLLMLLPLLCTFSAQIMHIFIHPSIHLFVSFILKKCVCLFAALALVNQIIARSDLIWS